MKAKTNNKEAARFRRKKHIRKVVSGTKERPRLVVFRSAKQVYAQLVNDQDGRVITGISSLTASVKKDIKKDINRTAASRIVGKAIAATAQEKGITRVVFDRNGYLYHGRVKAVAEGAREGGLEF
ncbi:50S ribosomal protein L18 [candidate division LCP-89 bacterium B3_LCP]|uniref:Large ribosomal subunit protein uL18 n=1 Tax=candidate division LCP-89 bacterium B3_LCP TaxID=2012998 RepID=A0A532UZU2_UNCL8|nr:MAG: 50S ribosomal protein L18 [candidate division LCP-89 bacterium B3_LCP]